MMLVMQEMCSCKHCLRNNFQTSLVSRDICMNKHKLMGEEDIKTYMKTGSTIFNKLALKLKSVLELTNIPESVLFGFNCYFLTLVGSYFNLLTLLTAAWIFAFTLPKVYTEKKESVDHVLQVAKDQVSLVKDKIVDQFNCMSAVKEGEKVNLSPVKEE